VPASRVKRRDYGQKRQKKNKKKVTVREYDAFKYYRAGDISLKALLVERHPLQRPLAKSGSGEL